MINKKNLMLFVSYAFNPIAVVVPLLQLIVYFSRVNLGVVYLVSTVTLQSIIPTLGTFFLVFIGQIDDFDLTNRENRYKLLIPASFLYLLAIFASPDVETKLLNLSLLLGIVFLAFVNISWKISGHTMLFTVAILNLALLINPAFLVAALLLPFIAYSRIYLKKHTFWQVSLGTVLGVVITLITFYIYLIVE